MLQGYGIFMFLWQFLIPLLVFIIAYWQILSIIRRQVRIAADETRTGESEVSNEVGSGGQNRSKTLSRAQINVVETMVYVTVCFTVCWMPIYFNVLFKRLTVSNTVSDWVAILSTEAKHLALNGSPFKSSGIV